MTASESAQVAEAAKREERLKAVFGARANEFREACYALFGYRVDMDSAAAAPGAPGGTPPPGTTFTLKPMHADDARVRSVGVLGDGVMAEAKKDVDMSGDA